MSRAINWFGYNKDGEHRVWWHTIERRRFAKAFFLHFLNNCLHIESYWFSRSCRMSLAFRDAAVGDSQIGFSLAIPFVIDLYISLERAKWVERLPGVDWKSGDYVSGEREISLRFFDNAAWWLIWRNDDQWKRNDWRHNSFHWLDFLFGRNKYSESERISGDYFLRMPEGAYPVKIELYTATWKRPRWPWLQQACRANIETEHGVPIPGKGENDWDCGDDALFGGTYLAETTEEALQKMQDSVIRDRLRYGGPEWIPDAGWPAHCEREA